MKEKTDLLKNFNQAFNEIIRINCKDEISVLDDFLEFTIAQASNSIRLEKNRFTITEIKGFWKLFQEWIKLMDGMVKEDNTWFDAFGLFYETYSSNWRRSKKGQFFTPENIVNLMISINTNKESEKLTISDPTCGSGRMLIASHAFNPKNYHFGEDIDKTCCLMSVLNMWIHGAVGEVVWHDSLDPNSFYGGWSINSQLKYTGIPHIEILSKEESFIMSMWKKKEENSENKDAKNENNIIQLGFNFEE